MGLRSGNCCARIGDSEWRFPCFLSSSWTGIVLAMILTFEIILCEMSFQVDFNSLGVTASSWFVSRVGEFGSILSCFD